jgi:hypothetical protein
MSGKFEPKQKVELDPPKDDSISLDYLSKCDGMLLIVHVLNVLLMDSLKEHMKDTQHMWPLR